MRLASRSFWLSAAGSAVAAGAIASGCGAGGATRAPSGRSSLQIDLVVSRAPASFVVGYRLRCDPPRGNVVDPAVSCAAIRRNADLLFSEPSGSLCIGGINFEDAHVRGSWRGHRIVRHFGHCGDGDVIDAWQTALRATHLEVSVLSGGRARSFWLTCGPAGGNVSDPARSCESLERDRLLLRPPPTARCRHSPQSVFVRGRYRARWAEVAIGSCSHPVATRRWIEMLLGFHTPPTR